MDNVKEYSVSELSGAVKRAIEDGFAWVRVRGELGRVVTAGSGHMYLDLKDDRAVLSGVIWKGNAGKLSVRPEQGMEVVATGRLTTFPGQSKYQIVIDTLAPAGVGALMAMFEERKKKLAAEGLFAPERKKPLPFLPEVIGVVTSPSGAVIRDILHRLRDRFPSHVLVWPTLVQGERAAPQVAAGIEGFNRIAPGGPLPRPDVLIVARGGGSLEDLWAFNEEVVARAAVASEIPLISAVGHETDTTLIDFVADQRAPTPTAAAEMAVPVRSELMMEVGNKARRLTASEQRLVENARISLQAARRGLGRAETLLEGPSQRLDRAGERLAGALQTRIGQAERRFVHVAGGARPNVLRQRLKQQQTRLQSVTARLTQAGKTQIARLDQQVTARGKLLETLSYKNTLARGYTLVMAHDGGLIRSAGVPDEGEAAIVRFADGERDITFGAAKTPPKTKKPGTKERPAKSARQTSLF